MDEQYDLELISRWLVLRRATPDQLKNIRDLQSFVDDELVKLASDKTFDAIQEAEAFEWTFSQIAASLGEDAFRKYDSANSKHTGGFLISAFEGVAIGLGSHYANRNDGVVRSDVRTRMHHLWNDPNFSKSIGSGISASSRIPRTVVAGRQAFG